MQTVRRNALGLIALTLVFAAAPIPAVAQARTPLDAYKAYLDAASKATATDALFPHISKEYKALLQKAPKAEVEKMLKMSIAKEKLQDIAVTSQRVGPSKAVLELKAKTGDGRPTTGKVTMVKEEGAWKLDEDAWATPTR